jgi:hypothetical protein
VVLGEVVKLVVFLTAYEENADSFTIKYVVFYIPETFSGIEDI